MLVLGLLRKNLTRMKPRLDGIGFFSIFLGLMPALASAGITGLSGGVSYPTPMGTAYSLLNHTVGAQADLLMDAQWLGTGFDLHFAASYDPYTLPNYSYINIHMMAGYAGLQYHTGEFGSDITFFASIDLGAVYDWMTFSNVTNSSQNTQVSFSGQAVMGVDIPISHVFGAVLRVPTRLLYFPSNPTVVWSPSLSVRVKL